MKRVLGAVALVLALAFPVQGQTAPATPASAEAAVRSFPEFSGVVLVAKDGKPVFRKAYGEANRELGVPNTVDGKFRIGSMTKAFTAAAIMQLQEAGKLKIDDPVSKYIANAPAAWAPITLRHLMAHTSGLARGLPRQGEIQRQETTPDKLIEIIRDQPLVFEPGKSFAYSNNGFAVLGKVVEVVSGQSYADYVRDHIMIPAGMTSSGYDVTATILPKRAAGYTSRDGRIVNASFIAMTMPYAAGSLYSTVDDLLRWDQALYGDTILSAASRSEMFRNQVSNPGGKDGYGFGWEVETKFGHGNINHGGGIPGFSSWIERYPDDRLTVIVLSNMETMPTTTLADNLAALYLGAPAPKPYPNAEAPIRRVFAALRRGEVAEELSPQGAALYRQQMATFQPAVVRRGELRTVELMGADANGEERYRLTFENSSLDWAIRFDAAGKITPIRAADAPR